jgi:hypothetical protein
LTGKSVFIAAPTYQAWVCIEYAASLLETGILLTSSGIGVQLGILPGNPFLDVARNKLVEEFLKSECTDLLFIDADVGWDAKMVTRVMSYTQEIVGGLVPKRDISRDDSFHDNALTGVISPEGLFQSVELPTAFMRVQRSVFEKMGKPWFGTYPFDPVKCPDDKGEDIYFNRKWASLGGFNWVDSDITFTHRGEKRWKGNFYDHCIESGKLKVKEAA